MAASKLLVARQSTIALAKVLTWYCCLSSGDGCHGNKQIKQLEEINVCYIKECGSTIVHVVVTELSPIKRSKKDEGLKYFTSQLSDEKKCVCHLLQTVSEEVYY